MLHVILFLVVCWIQEFILELLIEVPEQEMKNQIGLGDFLTMVLVLDATSVLRKEKRFVF